MLSRRAEGEEEEEGASEAMTRSRSESQKCLTKVNLESHFDLEGT